MAYNPALYSPYATQSIMPQMPQMPQPVIQPQQITNGLVWIDSIEGAQMYPQAPDSVSQPLFLKNEDSFIIKTTDGGGAATLKKYSFSEIPLEEKKESELYVTKEHFDSWANQMMEAIHGKRTVSEQSTSSEL